MPWNSKRRAKPKLKSAEPPPASKPKSKAKPKPKAKATTKRVQVTARRQRIAAQRVAGATVLEIAGNEGVSRNTINHELATGETQQIIVQLVDAQRPVLHELFAAALGVVRDAMAADQVHVDKYGAPNIVGPDHYARLTAVKRFLELLTAGRPIPRPPAETEAPVATWDQWLVLAQRSGMRV